MNADPWILEQPLEVLKTVDDPHLATATGTLGAHEVEAQWALDPAPDPTQGLGFRVFLHGLRGPGRQRGVHRRVSASRATAPSTSST